MKKIFLINCLFISCFLNAQITGVLVTEVANMPMAISNNAVAEGWANNTTSNVYSFGGIDSTKIWSGITNKSFRYTVGTNSWDTIPDLPNPNAVIAAGASWVDSIIYIMGGYQVLSNGNEISSNIVNRFDPRTNTYLSDGANIPVATDDHVQAVYNDSLIYVITGWSNTTNIPNVQIYDPTNDNWLVGTPVPNSNSYKAFGASGTIVGNTIYYHGGANTAFNFPCQPTMRIGTIDNSDPTQISWSPQATPFKTYRATCAIGDDGLTPFWIGGSEITYNYNGIAYNGSGGVPPRTTVLANVGGGILEESSPNIILPMDLRGIASISNSVKYIAGGMLAGQTVSNKAYLLEPYILTGIENNPHLNSFFIYPNPTSNQINIVFEKSENRKIQLLDVLGNKVLNLKNNSNTLQLNVSTYPKGIYFVTVDSENGKSSQKIIIQ